MVFGIFKKKAAEQVNKYSGRTDFLQAVCASAALVAAADGDIEDKEVEMTIKTITSNPGLSAAFPLRDIESTVDAMLKRAQSGRTGRMGLYKEIDDVAGDHEMAEAVFLTALDVSDSDGEIEPEEKVVLAKIAERLRLNPKDYEI